MMKQEWQNAVHILTEQDAVYQALTEQLIATETAYRHILQTLSQEDQEKVERYIALCEELDYRELCLAAELFLNRNGM